MTNTDYLREKILTSRGVIHYTHDLKSLKKSEWNKEFEYYQRNRLLLGAYRYGTMFDKPKKYNYADSIVQRLELYKNIGNKELLVDIANLAMLEFGEPSIEGTFFKSTDDTIHVGKI